MQKQGGNEIRAEAVDGLREHLPNGTQAILELALLGHQGTWWPRWAKSWTRTFISAPQKAAGAAVTIQWPDGTTESVSMF